MEFGTGALKITPTHDINDYQLGDKHSLEIIDILNDDGTLSVAAQLYVGQGRFEVRKQIAGLGFKGYLVKTEITKIKLVFLKGLDAVIEPKLSMQWFFKMGEFSTSLDNVMNDNIHFIQLSLKYLPPLDGKHQGLVCFSSALLRPYLLISMMETSM